MLWNLGMVYVVYLVARLLFFAENYNLYHDVTTSHFIELLRGGVTFDTSAILYTNALWVVMVLFPLHLKEVPGYHRVCRWVFVVVNVLTLAMNLGDSVYFRYTLRRTRPQCFRSSRMKETWATSS